MWSNEVTETREEEIAQKVITWSAFGILIGSWVIRIIFCTDKNLVVDIINLLPSIEHLSPIYISLQLEKLWKKTAVGTSLL